MGTTNLIIQVVDSTQKLEMRDSKADQELAVSNPNDEERDAFKKGHQMPAHIGIFGLLIPLGVGRYLVEPPDPAPDIH